MSRKNSTRASLKRNGIRMDKEGKLKALRSAAEEYARADQTLEQACGNQHDPISCTIFALKKKHMNNIPIESVLAAQKLESVVNLHMQLVQEYGMDTDAVRAIWFPILNPQ